MSKKGGYVIVDLKGQSITAGTPFTLDGVTARLNRAKTKACLLSGFAIGDEEKRDVFVDLQKTDDGYVALFGQYTMTINDDEVTITNGGILMDNIVDSQGNRRFVEGDGVATAVSGVTTTYNKWSLSGSHLMIVLCCSIANGTSVTAGQNISTYNIPKYIYDKVGTPVLVNILEVKTAIAYSDDYTSQNISIHFRKGANNLAIAIGADATATKDRAFRIQFDLLIDSEAE